VEWKSDPSNRKFRISGLYCSIWTTCTCVHIRTQKWPQTLKHASYEGALPYHWVSAARFHVTYLIIECLLHVFMWHTLSLSVCCTFSCDLPHHWVFAARFHVTYLIIECLLHVFMWPTLSLSACSTSSCSSSRCSSSRTLFWNRKSTWHDGIKILILILNMKENWVVCVLLAMGTCNVRCNILSCVFLRAFDAISLVLLIHNVFINKHVTSNLA